MDSIQTRCVSASNIIKLSIKLPPYDKNGSGTPVNGIKASKPPRFTHIWVRIYANVPKAIIEPRKVLALRAIARILYSSKMYSNNITEPPTYPNSSTIIGNIKSVCASGRYKYFCVDLPNPTPNRLPLLMAM